MDPAAALLQELRPYIADERVLAAMAALPRERFVPPDQQAHAYENVALPIGAGQTISQPLVVARMLDLLELRPDDRVLDVGTGSGYHAALLALLSGHVWTVERHPELSEQAGRVVAELGLGDITFVVGDGTRGLPDQAPFTAINVAAGATAIPEPLLAQLALGGRLVAPEGGSQQHLVVIRRDADGLIRERHESVRFVPLVAGQPPPPDEGPPTGPA